MFKKIDYPVAIPLAGAVVLFAIGVAELCSMESCQKTLRPPLRIEAWDRAKSEPCTGYDRCAPRQWSNSSPAPLPVGSIISDYRSPGTFTSTATGTINVVSPHLSCPDGYMLVEVVTALTAWQSCAKEFVDPIWRE